MLPFLPERREPGAKVGPEDQDVLPGRRQQVGNDQVLGRDSSTSGSLRTGIIKFFVST